MQIVLQHLNGEEIARASVIADKYGDLIIESDVGEYGFEFECALCDFREGDLTSGNFTDDNGDPCAQWVAIGDDPRTEFWANLSGVTL